MYKVFIPSAGIGSRLENYSKHINKALVTIGHKPTICYIIEKFPKDVEIVIAVGYKGDYLKQFLSIAYQDRKITTVDVDDFDGPKAGLGYTLLCAKEHLQCPFVFIPNDAIIEDVIPEPDHNYMGWTNVDDPSSYRTLGVFGNNVCEIFAKRSQYETQNAYIGLAGINDYKSFWASMMVGKDDGSIEIGESYALQKMINQNIKIEAKEFIWHDTGNISALNKTRNRYKLDDHINVLEKAEESIWFVDNKVIKFSIDEGFIKNRVIRAKELQGYVPEITNVSKNMYAYNKIEGDTFTYNLYKDKFTKFLRFIQQFWSEQELSLDLQKDFKNKCNEFYKEKTEKRIHLYFDRFGIKDKEEIINGKKYQKIFDMLNKIDWERMSDGLPTRFHGDLHFENIIVGDDTFGLIDWRQDFCGLIEYGDTYYDLAKLKHGLIISHEMVDKNMFDIKVNKDNGSRNVEFYFYRKNILVDFEKSLNDFIYGKYDGGKVDILTALIFLNIAALHHDPYSHLLFYLGKSMLGDILDGSY